MKRIKSWNQFKYLLENYDIISNSLIENAINDFWNKKVSKLENEHHVIAMFRISTSNNLYLTLGYLQKLNKDDKDYFIKYITNMLSLKNSGYQDLQIDSIIIDYGVREGIATKKAVIKANDFQNYKHYKLPITMNPLEYGFLLHNDIKENTYLLETTKGTIAKIKVTKKGQNYVQIFREGMLILDYTDTKLDNQCIERKIKQNIYLYKKVNDKYILDLYTAPKPSRFMKNKKVDIKKDDRIITLDIETLNKEGGLIPYLICWFDGVKMHSYYLTDFKDHKDMVKKALLDLRKPKYHNYKIYIHNLANFDAIFLLNELANIGILTPIIHEGKIITLKLTFQNESESKNFVLYFRDSYQILLSSLDKLSKSFKVETPKDIFPHKFVTIDLLDYDGSIPNYKFFDKLDENDYNKYCDSFAGKACSWNLKNEAIRYCEKDCVSLYQVLSSFNQLIFERFSINFNKYPTLPSLSNAVFLTHYLADHEIAMISGKIYDFIRQSYTGGAVDMYIPSNLDNELVYGYDVNSLYPYAMANFSMPIGKPTYFEGDIRKHNPDAFGFFLCEIETPEYLDHPIIQVHSETKGGLRTVAGLGKFKGVIFSNEMDNAIKLGYKFNILSGYTFAKGIVFDKFVNDLYEMRLEYDKSNPLNFIAKILLNSLYGRFGMNDSFKETTLLDKESFLNYDIDSVDIQDIIKLEDNFMVQINKDMTSTYLDNATQTHNVNIGIASAITSYARIVMSQYKNNPNLKLFYSDTDSIYTNLAPEEMNNIYTNVVSNTGLGKLKLETISNNAIFLAPKSYCLRTIDGDFIFKAKGLQKHIHLLEKDFEALLFKDSKIMKSQDKMFKILTNGRIDIRSIDFTLQHTDNKRELVFDSSGKLIATKPYKINEKGSVANTPSILELLSLLPKLIKNCQSESQINLTNLNYLSFKLEI